LRGVFLGTAAAFDDAFTERAGLDAVITGDGSDFGNDGKFAEAGDHVVEGKPKLGSAGSTCRFNAADVADDLYASREIKTLACFERLERSDAKSLIAAKVFGVHVVFESHEEFGSGSDGEDFERKAVALAVGDTGGVGEVGRRILVCFWRRLLCARKNSEDCSKGEDRD
jgi:hypothetical protein